MGESLVVAAAALLILTAAVHSLLGERRLVTPLMRERSGVLASAQYRFLLRLTWHLGSLLSIALAILLLTLMYRPDQTLRVALASSGVIFILTGLADAVATRGRHIGWPFLTAIGVVSLWALAVLRTG